ncbi:MAG: HipA domain-containing protein [Elusimicrobia bacterium]|nr:HipA domain-containing protein [Elusimicrobiota bacterium]
MTSCRICGDNIQNNSQYHDYCLKKLFGVDYVPGFDVSLPEISLKAQESAGKLSISGMQPKLSVKLNTRSRMLEVYPEHGEYILKPQTQSFQHLPENENLCMTIAALMGIEVPPHGLIKLKDNTNAYMVRRYDREKKKKIHQENFFQILGIKDKYSASHEEVGRKLKEISNIPGLDAQLFYERVLFNFIIGNGDAHLKNFSVIYTETGAIRLAPAYDIVCSKLVIRDEEDFALTLNGKKNKITGKDFIQFITYLDIPERAVRNKFLDKKNVFIEQINNSELTSEEKRSMTNIISERFNRVNWE